MAVAFHPALAAPRPARAPSLPTNVIPISSRRPSGASAPSALTPEHTPEHMGRPSLSLVAPARPSRATYLRRRIVALALLAGVSLVPLGVVQTVFADRGGIPATAPTAGEHLPLAGAAYVVQAGDTLWSIAERSHGSVPLVDYVEQLVVVNGGTALEVGQRLVLPGS